MEGEGRLFPIIKEMVEGFPVGSEVKHLPANEGDEGSIPSPGRFPCAARQLSPCATTIEPML